MVASAGRKTWHGSHAQPGLTHPCGGGVVANDNYHKDRIANRRLHPETLMMGYGYAPGLSEGSLKPPIFLTSTFVFETRSRARISSI